MGLLLTACGGGGGGSGGSRSSGNSFAYILDNSGLELFDVDSVSGALIPVANSVQGVGGNPLHTIAESITLDSMSQYAYMSHGSSSPEISIYSVNADTGVLTALPDVYQWNSQYSGLEDWSWVTVDPTGSFLFATDTGPDNQRTHSFQISDGSNANERQGQITELYYNNFVYNPNKVIVHPQGNLIFVTGFSNHSVGVAAVDTDPQSSTYGQISEIKNSTFDLGVSNTSAYNWPTDMVVSPDGKFLYIATSDNSTDNRIFIYSITQTTTATEDRGNLTLFRDFSTPGKVQALAIDPDPKVNYLFGVDSTNDQILPWKINAATGDLSPVDRLPGTPNVHDGYATAAGPKTLAIDPFGKYLYVGATDGTYRHTIDTSTGAVSEFNAAKDVPYGGGSPTQILIRYITK